MDVSEENFQGCSLSDLTWEVFHILLERNIAITAIKLSY